MHPEPGFCAIEVWRDEGISSLGQMDETERTARVLQTEAGLQTAIDESLFVRERATTFEYLYYFDSVDDLLEYKAERWVEAVLDETIVERARTLLEQGTSALVVRRWLRATRLRRSEG